ncbi:MAG: DUF177 domain-containing protein [Variovorax sp.]
MTREFAPAPDRMDVSSFAQEASNLSGNEPIPAWPRLSAELVDPAPDASVHWEAAGVARPGSSGAQEPWLHLRAGTRVPLVCQRCLSPVEIDLQVDRWFRFAADEATAAAEDEESEEDVLVSSREFDLHALIEDELLMEVPVTPRHVVCPQPVQLSAFDPDFEAAEAAKPNPFAVLRTLRSRDGSK